MKKPRRLYAGLVSPCGFTKRSNLDQCYYELGDRATAWSSYYGFEAPHCLKQFDDPEVFEALTQLRLKPGECVRIDMNVTRRGIKT